MLTRCFLSCYIIWISTIYKSYYDHEKSRIPIAATHRYRVGDLPSWLYYRFNTTLNRCRMGKDVLAARPDDEAYFMEEFSYNPFLGFPLLFANTTELRALLMSRHDAVFSLNAVIRAK